MALLLQLPFIIVNYEKGIRMKPFLLVWTIILSVNANSSTEMNFGVFPRIEKLSETHQITNITLGQLEKLILVLSYDSHKCNDHYFGDNSTLTDKNSKNIIKYKALAKEIHDLAGCFQIDAGMMALLLYKESQFCNFGGTVVDNQSRTDVNKSRRSTNNNNRAVGLGQFTFPAIRGIHDQLFETDRKLYHFQTRPKLHTMMAQCNYANGHTYPVGEEWAYYLAKPWKDDALYMQQKFTLNQLENPNKWQEQLLYTAIKLKVQLSKKNRPQYYTESNQLEHYKFTLREYNGATRVRSNGLLEMDEYWQYIFAAYNDIFLKDFKQRAKTERITYRTQEWNERKASIKNNIENTKTFTRECGKACLLNFEMFK